MKQALRRLFFLPLHPYVYRSLLKALRVIRIIPCKTVLHSDTPPRRILVVNITAYLGDTVMMMPFLDRLHALFPHAAIDLVTSAAMAGFAKEIPYLNQVYEICIPKRRIPVWSHYRSLSRFLHLVRTQMSNAEYDICFLPRWGTDPEMSIFFASMTSAARLFGHDPADEIDAVLPYPGVRDLLDKKCRGGHGLPEAVRELRLIETLPFACKVDNLAEETQPISILTTIADKVSLKQLREHLCIDDGPYIVLSPGASSPARRWNPSRFSNLAKLLHEKLGIQIVIIGTQADSVLGIEIADSMGSNCLNLAGRTSLIQTSALLRGAALVITNDSGPAHLAAGLAAPTLILSPCPLTCKREVVSSPLRCRPVGPFVCILQPQHPSGSCGERCVEATAHCILAISVEEVLENALHMVRRERVGIST